MPDIRLFLRRSLPRFCVAIYIVAVTLGAFTGGLWAALGIGGAVVMFLGLWIADGRIPAPSRGVVRFVYVAFAVFVFELPLSSHADISLKVWIQLASIFLPLALLTAPRLQAAAFSDSFVPAVAIAAFIGAVALGIELQSGGSILHMVKKPGAALTEYNRGVAHAVILAFPLFAGLWIANGKSAAALLGLALLFPACLTESHTAKLALIAGAVCAAAAFYRPAWVRRGLAAASVAIMGWPFYARWIFSYFYDTVEAIHPSWRHRIEIWDYLSYRIAERPLFGWGLGTTHSLDFAQPHGAMYKAVTEAAPHAHNFVTELWVETGVPGLALGLGFLLLVLRKAFALHPSLQPFAAGCWAAAVVTAMFGFDFWTDALWAAFALSAFAFGMLERNIGKLAARKP